LTASIAPTSASQRSVLSSRPDEPYSAAALRSSSLLALRLTPSTWHGSGSRPDAARSCSAGHNFERAKSLVAPNRTKVAAPGICARTCPPTGLREPGKFA
jgi:hypothetical protein